MNSERIQTVIHKLETGAGPRLLWSLVVALLVMGLGVLYDLYAYHGFSDPEAMDVAQVARNLEEGHGFTTEFIRPFSLYLVQKHNQAVTPDGATATNVADAARIVGFHPDLANAPVYPTVLAGLMKTWKPAWQTDTTKAFWSKGGTFQRYKPEFRIAIFNQVLLCVVVVLTFFITKKLFDAPAAWVAAALTFGSDLLWKFSVSGLSTMLLLVIFLGLIWCLGKTEELARATLPGAVRKLFLSAAIIGLLTALGMLTRYSFGWLIVPVVVYLILFGDTHRTGLVLTTTLTFLVVVSPWIARNLAVSGTFFGTAGHAFAEGTPHFEGTRLVQSLNPDFSNIQWPLPCAYKTLHNLGQLVPGGLLLTGGWAAVLFFAGLLLGLRNATARRLRYFILMSLGVFLLAEALGQTGLSALSPEINSENLIALLVPLMNIFGAAFLLTLVEQMKAPDPAVRYVVVIMITGLAWLPLLWTVVAKVPVVHFPPYYPPDIQKVSGWMQPDELMMSDVPWAVAWYGDRKCVWDTLNPQSEFTALNEFLAVNSPAHVQLIRGIYLTTLTLDPKLFSDYVHGDDDGWPNFAFRLVMPTPSGESKFPPGFPLQQGTGSSFSTVFLTDHVRWTPR
jgi:hypothetical protein